MAKRVKKKAEKPIEKEISETKDSFRDEFGRFKSGNPYAYKIGESGNTKGTKKKRKVLNQMAKIVFEGKFDDLPNVVKNFPYLQEAIEAKVLTWADVLTIKYMAKAVFSDDDSADRIAKDILDRIDGKPVSVIQNIDPDDDIGTNDSDRRSEIRNENRKKRLKALTDRAIREKADN